MGLPAHDREDDTSKSSYILLRQGIAAGEKRPIIETKRALLLVYQICCPRRAPLSLWVLRFFFGINFRNGRVYFCPEARLPGRLYEI